MAVPPSPPKPTAPFKPRTLTVTGPTRRQTSSRPKGPIYGEDKTGPDGRVLLDGHGRPIRELVGWKQPGKPRPCWDLTIACDGHRWYDRHNAAGRAQAIKEQLESHFRQGLDFDPSIRRFIAAQVRDDEPTVFTESVAWWRAHWSTIEPKSREETLRYISRPMVELVRQGAPAADGIVQFVQWQLLPPKPINEPVPAEHTTAAAWLRTYSLPVGEVDVALWQAYVDRWRTNSRTGRPLAQASFTRHLADVRQLWAWVCAVHQLPNPWQTVKTGARSSAGGQRTVTLRPVDRSIVLAPRHVRELARICGQGPFGPLAEVYILLLGIAGGRPGESAGVRTDELDLPRKGVGEVHFTRTNRRGIDASFLDVDDEVAWGPLKGREIQDVRTAPLPSCDAARIRELITKAGRKEPLFGSWHWDKFDRDVWMPAKETMASTYRERVSRTKVNESENEALISALARLRLHDLRHAACSMWLNTPGIEVRVACEWSGLKRLSVFLDVYQGLMPGSQASAKAKLEAAWGSSSS